jgi:serine/threonine protein kinase
LLGAGTLSDGKPYLVMQYVSGPTLRSEITTSGMDLSRVASIVRQIGVALDDIHDKGILHRDLKPENIMLQRLNDGTELVKIVDFGIAKVNDSAIDSATSHRATLGTVLYSSPEQVRGDRLLVGSDIYSMAVIAYELLTGRRPFIASTASQLLELQRAGVRVLPVELRSDITHDVQSVILKALSFNSCDRYRRAGDFGHRLESALEKDAHETRYLDGWRLRVFEGSLALLVCGAALLGISRYGRASEIPEK